MRKLLIKLLRNLFIRFLGYVDYVRYKEVEKSDPLWGRHFIGPAFKDNLYNYENQTREWAAIWKLTRTPAIWELAEGTFKWVAVGIPLNLLDKNQPEGDIDLMIALTKIVPSKDGVYPVLYRVFEVKTSKVAKDSSTMSLKDGKKFEKTKAQLKKLADFGAQQVFLLELYLAQAGYSVLSNTLLPPHAYDTVKKKFERMNGTDYGYIVNFLEGISGYSEEGVGVAHKPIVVRPAPILSVKSSFADLIAFIEDDIKNPQLQKNPGWIITYCHNCRLLVKTDHSPIPTCSECSKELSGAMSIM